MELALDTWVFIKANEADPDAIELLNSIAESEFVTVIVSPSVQQAYQARGAPRHGFVTDWWVLVTQRGIAERRDARLERSVRVRLGEARYPDGHGKQKRLDRGDLDLVCLAAASPDKTLVTGESGILAAHRSIHDETGVSVISVAVAARMVSALGEQ